MSQYFNPPTVVVVRVPVILKHRPARGLVLIRRSSAVEDGQGKLALPGGYQEEETWQEAGARELFEETGLVVQPEDLRCVTVVTTPNKKQNLLFCDAPPISGFRSVDQKIGDWHDARLDMPLHEYLGMSEAQYAQFIRRPPEAEEVLVVEEPIETAFPIHTAMVRDFFDREANLATLRSMGAHPFDEIELPPKKWGDD